ncbi:uncharacterized protein BKA78DRAFT_352486 [Phyllosticta capitalensis]|uniref:Uncharacterized protein n=1 Tax=Phyllosticta capitalensis TaxID=121624 RepID=A0ABR1YPC4_9PEZI
MSRIASRHIFLGGMVVGAGAAVPLTAWCMNRKIQPVDLSNGRLEFSNGEHGIVSHSRELEKAFKEFMDISKDASKVSSQRMNMIARGPRSIAELQATGDPELSELQSRNLNMRLIEMRLLGILSLTAAELLLEQAHLLGENHPRELEMVQQYLHLHQSGVAQMMMADLTGAWKSQSQPFSKFPDFDSTNLMTCAWKVDSLHVQWSYGFKGEVPKDMDMVHRALSTGYGLHDKSWAAECYTSDDENIKWVTILERLFKCFPDDFFDEMERN